MRYFFIHLGDKLICVAASLVYSLFVSLLLYAHCLTIIYCLVQVEKRDVSLGNLLGSLIQPRTPGSQPEAEDQLQAPHEAQVKRLIGGSGEETVWGLR